MIYVIMRFFDAIISVTGPVPYTIEECVESLSVLTIPHELQLVVSCEYHDVRPLLSELTSEQIELFNELYANLNN